MKKTFAALAALVALCSLAMGQVSEKPYTYTFDKGVGNCLFTGVSLDQVWAASMKAFMTQATKRRGRPALDLNRPSNTMTGGWKIKSLGITTDAPISIFFEQRADRIGMSCMVPGWANWKLIEKVEKAFFDKVAELLYGKPTTSALK